MGVRVGRWGGGCSHWSQDERRGEDVEDELQGGVGVDERAFIFIFFLFKLA